MSAIKIKNVREAVMLKQTVDYSVFQSMPLPVRIYTASQLIKGVKKFGLEPRKLWEHIVRNPVNTEMLLYDRQLS